MRHFNFVAMLGVPSLLFAGLAAYAPTSSADSVSPIQVVRTRVAFLPDAFPSVGLAFDGVRVTLADSVIESGDRYWVTATSERGGSYSGSYVADGTESEEVVVPIRPVGEAGLIQMENGRFEIKAFEEPAEGPRSGVAATGTFVLGLPATHPSFSSQITGTVGNRVIAGSRITIDWKGEFPPGSLVTQIVAFVDRQRGWEGATARDWLTCINAFCKDEAGNVSYRDSGDGIPLVTSFRVPKRMAGKDLNLVVQGRGRDEFGWIDRGLSLPRQWRVVRR
jgi:hypothetical protein